MRISPMLLVLSVLPSTANAQVTAIGPQPLRPPEQRILDIHNRERAAIGAQPLRWDAQLGRDATEHAQQLARAGRLAHASREGRGIARENVNQAFHGSSPDQLMANWLREKSHFRAGVFPNVSDTGNWYDVGHYSQIIWPTTLYVGCGSARGARWDYFVCRYSPGGNKDGKPVGGALHRAPGGMKGPIDSAKSRQRFGTPGQAHRQSNLDRYCNPPAKVASDETGDAAIKLREAAARREKLKAEIKRVQAAIQAAQAGLADYDPSLIEELLGTADAPPTEQLKALSVRLEQLMEEMRAEQEYIEGLLRELTELRERMERRKELCRDRRPDEY